MEHYSIPPYHNTFDGVVSYIYLLIIERSCIGISYGTSDTIVISSTKTEAHNLNTTIASAAPWDDSFPATLHTTTPENRHGSTAGMTGTDITNRLVLARQRRLLNLQTQITQLE